MGTNVQVLLAPAEIARRPEADLRGSTCVVFDILRATSVFTTALSNGATSIRPVRDIAEALAIRNSEPTILLAGERHGRRILAGDSGGVDFDLGNSPREFTASRVAGRRIVSTTTNGTRALRACAGADQVFAACFLNLTATASRLAADAPPQIILACAGTGEEAAWEDVLAAGALCHSLGRAGLTFEPDDAARIALSAFAGQQQNLAEAVAASQNGRRLLGISELSADVAFCAQVDITSLVVVMDPEGCLIAA